MKIFIYQTYAEMSEKAAECLADHLKTKPDSTLGFATGSTPVGMYGALVQLYNQNKIDFSRVRATFNLDEYYPIKKSDEQSYDRFMDENLFDHINIDKTIINIPDGEAADAEAECLLYEKKIAGAGGIDFQVLGIGNNGHIGFNEPDDHFKPVTHLMSLTKETIDANARFFASPELVPKNALTMGIGTIMSAKKILLLCASEKKAGIIRDTVYGNVTPKIPASILRFHPDVTVMTDSEAGKYLKSV